jgi:hypothetical protein
MVLGYEFTGGYMIAENPQLTFQDFCLVCHKMADKRRMGYNLAGSVSIVAGKWAFCA